MTTTQDTTPATYVALGGDRYTSSDPSELIQEMRYAGMQPTESQEAYMDLTAERCHAYNGTTIRTGDPAEFIQDLIDGGFLRPVKAG